jgi:hypothetical protein
MGYLTSTCRCKETYEYSQVFSREIIEIIQLSINIAIFEYPRWLKSFIFIFRSWQVTNIDSKLYICHSLHKYPWHILKSILGSLKTHRHRYLRLMSIVLVSILTSKLIDTHGWLRVMFSLSGNTRVVGTDRLDREVFSSMESPILLLTAILKSTIPKIHLIRWRMISYISHQVLIMGWRWCEGTPRCTI